MTVSSPGTFEQAAAMVGRASDEWMYFESSVARRSFMLPIIEHAPSGSNNPAEKRVSRNERDERNEKS